MIGIVREHALEGGRRLAEASLERAAVELPVVPGRRVHQRVGEQHGDVLIVGVLGVRRRHRVGIGAGERRRIGIGIG